jgi:tRNA-uridine 2-sulfurtransferase
MPNIYHAKDQNKDQTYFIWQIKKPQLEHILFPVGEFENKSEVRKYAESKDLITSSKPDSQGLCFVGQTNLREMLLGVFGHRVGSIFTFLNPNEVSQIGLNVKRMNKGFDLQNTERQKLKLGDHEGAFLFTIGQRQNLGISNGPWFVQSIDVKKNEVIVCHQNFKEELESTQILIKDCNWQVNFESSQKGNINTSKTKIEDKVEIQCLVQVRYRSKPQECILSLNLSQEKQINTASVKFTNPIKAVAAGQSAVFYDKSGKMLGGGIICKVT